jgi:nucleotide-binding universal stress UspA family protein
MLSKTTIMKKILVPIDFSERSEDALKVAAKIARKTDAEIYCLHLLDIPESEIDNIDGHQVPKGPVALMLFEQTHEKFNLFLDKDYLDNIPVYEKVMTDAPFIGITEFANRNNIDLIVMGSHGTSKSDDFFVGSNTEKIVRTSTIPVLVVKESGDLFKIEKVVIAAKFKGDHLKEFHKIMKFINIFEPEIHLVRINTPGNFKSTKELEENFENFIKKVPEYKDLTTVIYNDYTVQEGIFNYANSITADLVALSTRGRQGVMHFFSDSIAERVVNLAGKNILTIKIDK